MSKRKQTPDVLAEILGGGAAVQEAAVKSPATRPEARRQAEPDRPADPLWEYALVSFQDYKGWRPRFINGHELKDWTSGALIQEYLETMAGDGWELVAASAGERMFGRDDTHQLYFKRPLEAG